MKILTGDQIKEADNYTIIHEPISSIDLMERASRAIADWFYEHIDTTIPLLFLIGKGNNGGDGLAVARMLEETGYDCSVYLLTDNINELSEGCRTNLERLPARLKTDDIAIVENDAIIVDALLGSGVKGQLRELLGKLVDQINNLPNKVISVDLPSGMQTEYGNAGQTIVKADVTLTIEFPKLAMLLPEAGEYVGELVILPIGLNKDYIDQIDSKFYYITKKFIHTIKQKRTTFAHKGTYGHALLICGSKRMMGAALLSTGAALRSGCGLVTVHIPDSERLAVQLAYPPALLSLDEGEYFSQVPDDLSRYTSIGIGPGLGQEQLTFDSLGRLLIEVSQPMVIDADALNIIANNHHLKVHIPIGSILTPHLGELRRLVGGWKSEREKITLVRELAAEIKSIIIVKGAHTMVCSADGDCYFNSTGNSGMAKGGSGDVLTGYLTGLLARGYSSLHAAILGVYMHGLAGDKAASKYGLEAMNSYDLINELLEMKN